MNKSQLIQQLEQQLSEGFTSDTHDDRVLTPWQFRQEWTAYKPTPLKELIVTKNYKQTTPLKTERTRRGYIKLA